MVTEVKACLLNDDYVVGTFQPYSWYYDELKNKLKTFAWVPLKVTGAKIRDRDRLIS